MFYLFISMATSLLLPIILKTFPKYNIHILKAIILNYLFAVLTGIAFNGLPVHSIAYANFQIVAMAIFQGFMFITILQIIAKSTQESGLGVTATANKMSLAFPVILALSVGLEQLTLHKIIGITTTFIAIYLLVKQENNADFQNKKIIYPIIVFVGSGMIDSIIYLAENFVVPETLHHFFTMTVFTSAGIIGLMLLLLKEKKLSFSQKEWIGGAVLGIPNYFSLYFLIVALNKSGFDKSVLFLFNNLGIVLLSALVSVLVFKERFNTYNWVGFLVAIASILLLK